MESSVKQRLIEFIQSKGLSNSKFEKMCGLPNAYVQNIRNSITNEKLEQISKVFPDLNRMWLVLGEGDMIIGSRQEKPTECVSVALLLEEKDKRIEELKEQIERLNADKEAMQRDKDFYIELLKGQNSGQKGVSLSSFYVEQEKK